MMIAVPFALYTSNAQSKISIGHEIAQALARQKLAETIQRVEQNVDVKEASDPGSRTGGKDVNANDGNSFLSTSTYHSHVWDNCLDWAGGIQCQQWLDPYVSEHGFGADKSPLEAIVGSLWQGMKSMVGGNSYKIWDVQKRNGGSLLDNQGKLDRTDLTKFELKKEVKKEVEEIGTKTATNAIRITMDESAGQNEAVAVAPPMEGLRTMASAWTKTLRNRLVTNLGELRAADKGIEFALSEDTPDCESYLKGLERDPDRIGGQIKMNGQARLDAETMGVGIEERYQKCVALRQTSVNMVNPKIQGNQIGSGSTEDEQIDKWRSRANIALIDRAGIDPSNIAKPSDANLSNSEIANPIASYTSDAGSRIDVMTNADQLESYNGQLRAAAAGMKAVAAKSPQYIVDASDQILSKQIKPGSMSSIEINDLTPEMRGELKDTGLAKAQLASVPAAERVERTPSQLTVTALR